MLFDLTANSNSRKLMVLNPEFPKDLEIIVIKGNTTSASFSVDIAEHGKPAEYTYQWYVNDAPVEGATKATYERTGLAESETLTIYCDVTNKKGTVRSRAATLKVTQYYTPVLDTSYPKDATVVNESSVTCQVHVSTAGNPASYTYQWYKNGVAISGATSSSYTYTPSLGANDTLYCKVTNSAGTVTSRTATISVTGLDLFSKGKYSTVSGVFKGTSALYYSSEGQGSVPAPTVTISNNLMVIVLTAGHASTGAAISTNKVDVTNFKTLTVNIPSAVHDGNGYRQLCVGLYNTASGKFTSAATYKQIDFNPTQNNITIKLDITNITGQKYVAIGIYGANHKVTVKVSDIKLSV